MSFDRILPNPTALHPPDIAHSEQSSSSILAKSLLRSQHVAAQFCLRQPDTKIPRPRNGE